jgi:predicted metalloprotease
MNLDDAPQSDNVQDNRGNPMPRSFGGGGGSGGLVFMLLNLLLRGGGAKSALGGTGMIIIVLLLLCVFFGQGLFVSGPQEPNNAVNRPVKDEKTLVFTRKVVGTTESVWHEEFRRMGKTYEPPQLELFSNQVKTGCGVAPSAVGPFYCPKDRTVYLDPTFFDELENQLGGSKAEFSQAYVIAHEVAHHVQNLLGYMEKRGRGDDNDFSVRLELQADYLAGVWAYHGQRKFNFIEPGDVEAAIKSANAIGDDRLQKRSGGFVHPEKFTHGTSSQRVKWFKTGLRTGDTSPETLDYFFRVRSSREL